MKKVLTVLVCFLTIFSVRAANGRLAIINAELIDGKSDRVQSGVTVLISDGKIESVKRGGKVPKDYETIDIAGATLMPGFIDAHTHIRSLSSAKRALESGVTTVRSASTPNYQDVNLRELVKSGVLSGPDMVAAGVFVTPNLGETVLADPRLSVLMNGVNSEEELRMLVRINADRGVDFIKTRGTERAGLPNTDPRKQTYTQEQLAVIVDEANKHNIPVMAHAHGDEGGYAAVAAGVKSIEHGTYLSEKTLKLMKQKGTYLVPTFTTVVDLTEPGGDYDNPVLFIRGQHMLSALEKTVKRAYEIGIKIVTGADTGYGPNSVTRVGMEITNFVKLGMKPMDAIRSATSVGAELLQISDRTGTVTVGKEADLVVVPDNPLEDIRSVQDVVLVISNGVIAMNRLPFSKE
ncbi:MAG TPA: amidohydrolase family protein [Candidatus Marinimicrobia bacterium]|nr:amidohydrolase family protein [Candidatus Neomarinimicrobiota bacterium]HIC73539.1 amidohydrolase family protein [Candidatus Neomarinimicrobiota bacterium]HIN61726.1 amidohydrolase family protein [Candidatus Neomarinimicrobiota bacterium]HIO35855.1 amidohydrolase family protein [Candidatus Neomarinimicrobiota bacterium]HIO88093.1 amidohydrolase family protein [Candidatus Neomarinimicrobiota bacterium]